MSCFQVTGSFAGFVTVLLGLSAALPFFDEPESCDAEPLIIDGEPSARGRWPWVVAIIDGGTGQFICGGTLLTSHWVIGAAHCLHGVPDDYPLAVKIGAFNLTANDESERIAIEKVIFHPEYDHSGHGVNDLVMVKLIKPSDLENPCVGVIDLPSQFHFFDNHYMCWIIGWGAIENPEDRIISEILMEKRVNILHNNECSDRWDTFFGPPIMDNHVCVDESTGVSACYGDSGSPMQCYLPVFKKWAFAGVSSWGSSVCRDYPSVYMRVSSFNVWIRRVIKTK